MLKFTTLLAIPFFCFSLLFTNCKSNQTEDSQAKLDSLAAAANTKTVTINEYNKYAISPPDTDYTGDYVKKYPNGIIQFQGGYRFGLRHGQWMSFYENGEKWSETFYDKGKRQGASNVYYLSGKLHYAGWYKNDLRDSLWLFYDEAGKEIDRRAYREDVETGLVN
jgi:hypothetical protein